MTDVPAVGPSPLRPSPISPPSGEAPSSSGEMAVLPDDEAARRLLTSVVTVPAGRDAVLVAGPEAASYLQGQCSQEVASMAVGASVEALLLAPQGKLEAFVRVTRMDEERFVVDVDAGFGPAVVARLVQFRLRVKVEVTTLDWRCVALRGPGATAVGAAVPGAELVAPWSWPSMAGVDLFGPAVRVPADIGRASAGVWEAARIESGVPKMGAELDERTIPAEADLLGRAVSFTKGCYTGQELVARLDARGNRVARHLRAVVIDPPGSAPTGGTSGSPAGVPTGVPTGVPAGVPAGVPGGVPAGVPAAGWEVVLPRAGGLGPRDADVPDAATSAGATTEDVAGAGKVVGALTSVAWSQRLGRQVALAFVHRSVDPPAAVRVRPPNTMAPSGSVGDGSDGGEPGGSGRLASLTAEVRHLPLA